MNVMRCCQWIMQLCILPFLVTAVVARVALATHAYKPDHVSGGKVEENDVRLHLVSEYRSYSSTSSPFTKPHAPLLNTEDDDEFSSIHSRRKSRFQASSESDPTTTSRSTTPKPRYPEPVLSVLPKYRVAYYDSPNQLGMWDDFLNEFHVWQAPEPSFGKPWPLPANIVQMVTYYEVPQDLSFNLKGAKNYILEAAIARCKHVITERKAVSFYPLEWNHQQEYLGAFVAHDTENSAQTGPFPRNGKNVFQGVLKTVSVKVAGTPGRPWPHLNMDESYTLKVTGKQVQIEAHETWGALAALETLAQLVWRTSGGRLFINQTSIQDKPVFPHRGLLVDTSRHFIHKSVLLTNLDAMAMNKMNVFHWHIVDDQSFPFVSKSHPHLSTKGSFGAGSLVYTAADVREIIEYARIRGIRVIPEFDSPGHTWSWGQGYPELLTKCYRNQAPEWSGYLGPLNPAKEHVFTFVQDLFRDVLDAFNDDYLHLGGDEVGVNCWSSNPDIQALMQKYDMYSTQQVNDYYFRRLQNIITKFGIKDKSKRRGFIVWQEAYDNGIMLKNGTIVQFWKSESVSELYDAVRKGVRVLYTGCWYLDHSASGVHWIKYYMCSLDPDEVGPGKILGGEAAMWSEYQSNETILSRMWPLASAPAERLWSKRATGTIESVAFRMEEQRCRMLLRGIPASVAGGPGVCPHEVATTRGNMDVWPNDMDFNVMENKMKSLMQLLDAHDGEVKLANGRILSFVHSSTYYKLTLEQILLLMIAAIVAQFLILRLLEAYGQGLLPVLYRLCSPRGRWRALALPLLGLASLSSLLYFLIAMHSPAK